MQQYVAKVEDERLGDCVALLVVHALAVPLSQANHALHRGGPRVYASVRVRISAAWVLDGIDRGLGHEARASSEQQAAAWARWASKSVRRGNWRAGKRQTDMTNRTLQAVAGRAVVARLAVGSRQSAVGGRRSAVLTGPIHLYRS